MTAVVVVFISPPGAPCWESGTTRTYNASSDQPLAEDTKLRPGALLACPNSEPCMERSVVRRPVRWTIRSWPMSGRIIANTRRLLRGAITFGVTIRRLEPTEWPTAQNLRVAALTESPGAFGSTVVRERGLLVATWRARLTANAWFAAFDGEIAVGLACGVHTETPDERELTGVWVAPSHRGTGLGDALVTSVRDWAVLQGAHRLTLEVGRVNESAIDLYTRHGFEVVGQTDTPGHGLRENDIAMRLDLRRLAPPAVRIERGSSAGTT
jgi:ribosomal protein S18 acetylase RimI-like enzyme